MKKKWSCEKERSYFFFFLTLFQSMLLFLISTLPLLQHFYLSLSPRRFPPLLFLLINDNSYLKQFSLYIQPLFPPTIPLKCLLKERRKRQKQTEEKKKRKSNGKKASVTLRLLFLLFMNKKKLSKRKLTENIVLALSITNHFSFLLALFFSPLFFFSSSFFFIIFTNQYSETRNFEKWQLLCLIYFTVYFEMFIINIQFNVYLPSIDNI